MTTIKEIAEIVGTSTTTVSNVIHGKLNKVSKENVERIRQVIAEKNYILPMGMSALTNKQSRIIGVVIHITKYYDNSFLADPFYGEIIGTLERVISQAGYYMMLYSSESLDEIYKMAMAWNVDGLVAITFRYGDYRKLCTMVDRPVVAIDLYNDLQDKMYNVGLADEEGGYLMTNYLIRCGFRKILILANEDVGVDHVRWQGYRRALQEAGIPYKKEYYIMLSDQPEKRTERYKGLMRYAGEGCAMFFVSDLLAIEAMGYFQRNGCRIPEDISIAGFDDIPFAAMTVPSLTTIRQDISRRGETAGNVLLGLLGGKEPEENNILLPVSLCVRESVKKLEKDLSNL